jgi:membrane protein implicated in regulation of membrane protease activity
MLIILAIVLLLLLPSPWGIVAFIVIVPIWVLELVAWNRTVKHQRRVVGAQTLIDQEAVVVTNCRPNGQVRIEAEIWEARCDAGAAIGDTVHVTGREGLTLIVEPSTAAEAAVGLAG